AAARNEAPVLQLDHVENPLLHPLRVHVLRIHTEPLSQRIPLRRQALTNLMRTRERMLRRDVIAVRREPTKISRPSLDQLIPSIREVRRHLNPHVWHQPAALGDQALDVIDRNRVGPARNWKFIGLGIPGQRCRGLLRSRLWERYDRGPELRASRTVSSGG